MECRGTLSLGGANVVLDVDPENAGVDVALAATASVFAVLAVAALAVLLVRRNRRKQHEGHILGEHADMSAVNPLFKSKGNDDGEEEGERESMVVSNIRGSLASIETALVDFKKDMDNAL